MNLYKGVLMKILLYGCEIERLNNVIDELRKLMFSNKIN